MANESHTTQMQISTLSQVCSSFKVLMNEQISPSFFDEYAKLKEENTYLKKWQRTTKMIIGEHFSGKECKICKIYYPYFYVSAKCSNHTFGFYICIDCAVQSGLEVCENCIDNNVKYSPKNRCIGMPVGGKHYCCQCKIRNEYKDVKS